MVNCAKSVELWKFDPMKQAVRKAVHRYVINIPIAVHVWPFQNERNDDDESMDLSSIS